MFREASLGILAFFFSSAMLGQVATGSYTYGTFDNFGFDTINVGNLNVHFSLPVLQKTGRGLPFYYNLSYDSSVFYPATINGVNSWEPVQNFGWRGDTEIVSGYVSYSQNVTVRGACTVIRNGQFVYHDTFGTSHPFNGVDEEIIPSGSGTCSTQEPPTGLTAIATDGSGYTIVVTGLAGAALTAASGKQIIVPTQEGTGAATLTDTNGNQVSVNSSGAFKDTTGNTVLTVSGNAPNPKTFTYTDTNGNPQKVQVNYVSYTVQTAFAISGVGEYGPLSNSLVSSIVYPDGSTYSFTYEPTQSSGNCTPLSGTYSAHCVTARLASVTLPTGGQITYQYTHGTNGIESDGSTAGLTRTLSASDGSAASTWKYSRSTGSGTSQTAVTDGLLNSKTYTFVEASNQPAGTTAVYYETSRTINQGTSTTVLARNTCYNAASSPCATTIPTLPFTQIDTYETLNGLQTHGATAQYNGYGMETESDIYDFGGTSRGSLLRRENWTYGYSIANLPTIDMVYDGSSNALAHTVFSYDGGSLTTSSGVPQHVSASGARGNLTGEQLYWTSQSNYLTLSMTYEDTGSLLTETTPNGTSTFSYDPTFVYTTGTSLPTPSSGVAIAGSSTFDTADTGLPQTATDPNLEVTTFKNYNSMLQPGEIVYPDGGRTTFTYWNPNQVGVDNWQSATTYGDTEHLLDGYGRPSRIAVINGQSSNPYYQQDTCYDANSNANFVSYPYQGTGWGTPKVCSGSGDTYTYDVLGRATAASRANGDAYQYTYSGRATKSVDANGVTRITQVDGLGRPTIVCEISSTTLQGVAPVPCGTDISGTGFITSYSYSYVSSSSTIQTKITQGAQTRTFQTDWLGRTTQVVEPESGTTSYAYAYNSTGLLTTRIRPTANQTGSSTTTTTSQYDSLGRILTISYSDGTPTKTFTYDASRGWSSFTQQNLKGRLSAAYMPVGAPANGSSTLFSYDTMGRIAGLGECTPSACGTASFDVFLAYTYDQAGNMLTSSDGGGVTSTYTVSPAGELLTLTSSTNNTGNPPNIISNMQNGPTGPNIYSLGNGLSAVRSYDSIGQTAGGWVCNGSTQNGCTGGTQSYGFTSVFYGHELWGNCDTVLNKCFQFGYDGFGRLTARTVTQGTAQNYTYGYDRYGNRWSQTPLNGGSTTSLSFSATTNQISTSGYTYDAAGNMTNDGFHAYGYDAEGNIISVDSGATASYVYDAFNHRVETTVGSAKTDFVFNAAGQRVSTWNGSSWAQIQGQYYWGGKPVAFYKGGATYFQHQDWMGTERLRTTYNGGVEGTFTSLPFGDDLTTASGTDNDAYHFASLDHDYETDTDHAHYRQYSNYQGRWMSPDPYTGSYDLSNPQTLNRYAYALSNPLALIDPSGLDDDNSGDPSTGDGGGPSSQLFWDQGNECWDYFDQSTNQVYVCVYGRGNGQSPGVPGGTNVGGNPPGGGGPGGGAPNNGRSGYESLFCLGDALKSNGLSLALDAVGLIPAGGSASAAFSLFHGAAGVSNGTNILARFQMGAGLIGTASSSNEGNWLGTATGVASIGAALGKAAPVYGQVLSGISLGIDAVKTYQAQSACVDSGKYD